MESTAENGRIQVSAMAHVFLETNFHTELRGLIECKGLGEIQTYYLNAKK
jgi:hypothetical protein